MVKCEICKGKIPETFLNKPIGTVIKDTEGKKHWVCSTCQKGKTKEQLLGELK